MQRKEENKETKQHALRPLFPDTPPEYIYYSPAVPSSKDFKLSKIRPEKMVEIARSTGMKAWCETILYDVDLTLQNSVQNEEDTCELGFLLQLCHCALDSLVICYMNEQLGHGVFALHDIPAATTVSFYAGHLQMKSERYPDKSNLYGFAIDDKIRIISDGNRNTASFFQHLPDPEADDTIDSMALSNYCFRGNTQSSDVAVSNLREGFRIINGAPLVYFRTARYIKAGEMLGYNFGNRYWEALQKLPILLTRMGMPLDPTEYYYNKIKFQLCISGLEEQAVAYFPVELLKRNFSQKEFIGCTVSVNTNTYWISKEDFEFTYRRTKNPFMLTFPRPSAITEQGLFKRNPLSLREEEERFMVRHWENPPQYEASDFERSVQP